MTDIVSDNDQYNKSDLQYHQIQNNKKHEKMTQASR